MPNLIFVDSPVYKLLNRINFFLVCHNKGSYLWRMLVQVKYSVNIQLKNETKQGGGCIPNCRNSWKPGRWGTGHCGNTTIIYPPLITYWQPIKIDCEFSGSSSAPFRESQSRFFGRLGVGPNARLRGQIINIRQPFILKKDILLLLRPRIRTNLACTHQWALSILDIRRCFSRLKNAGYFGLGAGVNELGTFF